MAFPQWQDFDELQAQYPGVLDDIEVFNKFILDLTTEQRLNSREEYRSKYSDWMTKQFLYAKGRDRRANQHDPKIIFINLLMRRHFEAREKGDL